LQPGAGRARLWYGAQVVDPAVYLHNCAPIDPLVDRGNKIAVTGSGRRPVKTRLPSDLANLTDPVTAFRSIGCLRLA
jgi:hypothetical protein